MVHIESNIFGVGETTRQGGNRTGRRAGEVTAGINMDLLQRAAVELHVIDIAIDGVGSNADSGGHSCGEINGGSCLRRQRPKKKTEE